jgi:hypothetical protein
MAELEPGVCSRVYTSTKPHYIDPPPYADMLDCDLENFL